MPKAKNLNLGHGIYKHQRDKCQCEVCIAAVRDSNTKARAKRRELINSLKSSPCLDCGGSFPPECMDFDHTSDNKVLEIGTNYRRKLTDILAEIEKCDLICANCHRIRTKNRLLP